LPYARDNGSSYDGDIYSGRMELSKGHLLNTVTDVKEPIGARTFCEDKGTELFTRGTLDQSQYLKG
jgi:hypothetical protein